MLTKAEAKGIALKMVAAKIYRDIQVTERYPRGSVKVQATNPQGDTVVIRNSEDWEVQRHYQLVMGTTSVKL